MKITKRQLRKIINEEKSRLLNEGMDQDLYGKIDSTLAFVRRMQAANMRQRGIEYDTLDMRLQEIIDRLLDAIDHMDKSS